MSEEAKKELRFVWDSFETGTLTQAECFQKIVLILANEGLIN